MAILINATEDDRKLKTPYPGGATWWNFEDVEKRLKGRLRRPPKPRTLSDEDMATIADVDIIRVEEL
jgi:hypothetical protein